MFDRCKRVWINIVILRTLIKLMPTQFNSTMCLSTQLTARRVDRQNSAFIWLSLQVSLLVLQPTLLVITLHFDFLFVFLCVLVVITLLFVFLCVLVVIALLLVFLCVLVVITLPFVFLCVLVVITLLRIICLTCLVFFPFVFLSLLVWLLFIVIPRARRIVVIVIPRACRIVIVIPRARRICLVCLLVVIACEQFQVIARTIHACFQLLPDVLGQANSAPWETGMNGSGYDLEL